MVYACGDDALCAGDSLAPGGAGADHHGGVAQAGGRRRRVGGRRTRGACDRGWTRLGAGQDAPLGLDPDDIINQRLL